MSIDSCTLTTTYMHSFFFFFFPRASPDQLLQEDMDSCKDEKEGEDVAMETASTSSSQLPVVPSRTSETGREEREVKLWSSMISQQGLMITIVWTSIFRKAFDRKLVIFGWMFVNFLGGLDIVLCPALLS